MNIFLLGSCRIHRPFNCDRTHENGYFTNYNCLTTKWFEPNFIGSVYCSNYILMLVNILLSRNVADKDKFCYPHILTDDHFYQICDSFTKAQTVIIEIATLKFRKSKGIYISNEELDRYPNYESGNIDEAQLAKNVIELQTLIQKAGKQVLFVSPFQINPRVFDRKLIGRKQIIDCLSKHATYFFNPTPIVQSNISTTIVDSSHYSHSCEVLIMNELHRHLQVIQSKHFSI